MKKFWTGWLVLLVLLFAPGTAQAAETVNVTLPTFTVTLNGVQVDSSKSQYPFLVYKEITYVPMTYDDAQLLGLSTYWSAEQGLSVNKKSVFDPEKARSIYAGYPSEQVNSPSQQAALAQFAIQVSGEAIDNTQEQYPLLIFRDVTYFPLTWRFAHDSFGWDYTFDQTNGLVITPKATAPQPVISTSGKLPEEVRVTGNVVNIRSQATTESSVVVQVQSGDVLTVLSADGDWYQVLVEDGKIGWIANWLVETAEGTAQGQTNSLTASAILDAGRQSQVVLQTGVGNTVSVSQSAAGKLVLTAANNTTELFTAQSGSNLITQVTAEQTGNKARVTITTDPKAYSTVDTENGVTTVTARRYSNASPGVAGKIIVLDPGHGNLKENGLVDPGAIGLVKGYTDREIGEAVTLKLKTLLEAQGATVIVTRDLQSAPKPMTLQERADVANDIQADAFVSIHGNALDGNTTKSGAEIHYWGSNHLTPCAQKQLRLSLAQSVKDNFAASTGRPCVVKESNFAVLRENDCPSILVETGYLSNAEEEALLMTDAYQMQIAQGILNGLQAFFQ